MKQRRKADGRGMSSTEFVMPITTATRKRRIAKIFNRDSFGTFLFLLPLLVIFGLFSWFPIVRAIVMSFQQTNLFSDPTWVGLDNFASALANPMFARAIINTLYFTLLALIFGYPIPIILALIMSEARRGRRLFSALAYLPVVIPPVVSVLLWKTFYNGGVINSIIGAVGLGPIAWLQDTSTSMPSLVIVATWANAGGTVIIYLAALLSVPTELYDAADVDGASILRKIRHITLPHLRGVLFLTLILQLIATSQLFTEPQLLTQGGPVGTTTSILLLIYQIAFQNSLGGDYGQAAAISLMLALFLAAFTAVYFRLTRGWSTTS
jgi:multiple sugar transport system permease protein